MRKWFWRCAGRLISNKLVIMLRNQVSSLLCVWRSWGIWSKAFGWLAKRYLNRKFAWTSDIRTCAARNLKDCAKIVFLSSLQRSPRVTLIRSKHCPHKIFPCVSSSTTKHFPRAHMWSRFNSKYITKIIGLKIRQKLYVQQLLLWRQCIIHAHSWMSMNTFIMYGTWLLSRSLRLQRMGVKRYHEFHLF